MTPPEKQHKETDPLQNSLIRTYHLVQEKGSFFIQKPDEEARTSEGGIPMTDIAYGRVVIQKPSEEEKDLLSQYGFTQIGDIYVAPVNWIEQHAADNPTIITQGKIESLRTNPDTFPIFTKEGQPETLYVPSNCDIEILFRLKQTGMGEIDQITTFYTTLFNLGYSADGGGNDGIDWTVPKYTGKAVFLNE